MDRSYNLYSVTEAPVRRAILSCLTFALLASAASAQSGPTGVIFQEIDVDHGDYIAGGDGYGYCPQTGAYQNERSLTASAAVAIVQKIGMGGIYGSLASAFLVSQFEQQIHQAGGTIKEWLEGFGAVDSYAACGNVTLAAPPYPARIVAINAFASDEASAWDLRPCPADGNGRYVCNIGWSEWVWSQNDRFVTGIYKNWSGDRLRHARLEIVYETPPTRVTITNKGDRALNFTLRPKDGKYAAFTLAPRNTFNYTNADFIRIVTKLENGQVVTKEYPLIDAQSYVLTMNSQDQSWDVFHIK